MIYLLKTIYLIKYESVIRKWDNANWPLIRLYFYRFVLNIKMYVQIINIKLFFDKWVTSDKFNDGKEDWYDAIKIKSLNHYLKSHKNLYSILNF